MSNVQKTINRIRAFAMLKGWSKRQFAAEAGISDTTLRHFDKPDWNPTRSTLERLESVIPKSFNEGRAA